jgi:hypothetical protein
MAAELGLLSLTQLQKLAHSKQNQNLQQLNPTAWMWNPKQDQEDDDSWEVRAFAEDTGNAMGTTWPPRSYTCTFCRREFRSAQALGGHMNVHRRDRARLHQAPLNPAAMTPASSTSSFLIPTQEFVANGGLCLLYQLPNPTGAFMTSTVPINAFTESSSPSTLPSISPSPPHPLMSPNCSPSIDFPLGTPGTDSFHCHSSKAKEPSSQLANKDKSNEDVDEDLDLELRLGQRPMPS